MNKKEFVERLSKKGYTKKDSNIIVDDFVKTLCECLIDGEEIMFIGLGSFKITERRGHLGTDPKTHEKIIVKSYKIPKFSPSPGLIEIVRRKKE